MSRASTKTSKGKEASTGSEFTPNTRRNSSIDPNTDLTPVDNSFMAAIVPVELMQQVIDLLRNEPLPFKMTSPLISALGKVVMTRVNPVN